MSVRVGLGPGLGMKYSAQSYWQWIEQCEASGLDSIWHSDQLIGPALEPMSMLAALAARSNRMRFGTSALVAPFRDPIVVAKEIATIDFLAPGRVLPVFGVGNGADPYWEATGTPTAGRGAKANETIELVRLLLEREQVQYAGTHFRYTGPGVYPRPAKPIPLWIGGNSEAAFKRSAALGDGWLGSMIGPEQAGAARKRIEAELAVTERMIDGDHYGMTLMARLGSEDHPAVKAALDRLAGRLPPAARQATGDMLVTGSSAVVANKLRRYVDAGISKFVLLPIVSDMGELIDQTERLVNDVLPVVENRTV